MSDITLQDFKNVFKYYKEGLAHQEAAVEKLFSRLDDELKSEGSDWFQTFRNTPIRTVNNPLEVPYQWQRDNASGQGDRECFSSCCAMVAMFYGKVANDDEYNKVRAEFGDTTHASSHVKALGSLGLKAEFITNATTGDLKRQIDEGRPTPCGWLHHGPTHKPRGTGHYAVIIGYNQYGWIVNDPFGEADLISGGYYNYDQGESQLYLYDYWNPRWVVEGEGSGWMMDIRDA